jgi:hypothetical protein
VYTPGLNSFSSTLLCVYNFVLYCVLYAATTKRIFTRGALMCTEITEHRHWHDREMSIVWHREEFLREGNFLERGARVKS